MKKLTPEQLQERLGFILEQYPGIPLRCVKFAVQLETLTEMPRGDYVGAFWDNEYGVIVYSNKSDKPYINKYAGNDATLYWNLTAAAYWRATSNSVKEKQAPKRGRPPKDWSLEYLRLLEDRERGLTIEQIAHEWGRSESYIKQIKQKYQEQKNRELC